MSNYTINKFSYSGDTYNLEDSRVDSIVDVIYPIGSIYMSVNSANPSTLFTGTYWEQLTNTFLVAATATSNEVDVNQTVASNGTYDMSTVATTLGLVAGDIFTVTLSTGEHDVFTYQVLEEQGSLNQIFNTWATTWVIHNNSSSSITISKISKGIGSADGTDTTAIGGQANVKLTGNESGEKGHGHTASNGAVASITTATSSGGPSTANTGSGGAWGFRSSALLPRTGATGLVGTESNVTLSKSSTTRYSISSNSNTTAKTAGTIEDTVNYAGHTHTLSSHTHTIAHGHSFTQPDISSVNASDATYAHDNMPPYLPVYMWKRVAPPAS